MTHRLTDNHINTKYYEMKTDGLRGILIFGLTEVVMPVLTSRLSLIYMVATACRKCSSATFKWGVEFWEDV